MPVRRPRASSWFLSSRPRCAVSRTILYNSIYRGDDQLLVNTHVYGVPAARAPVWHLRKVAGGEITATYLDSFERVWDSAVPAEGI